MMMERLSIQVGTPERPRPADAEVLVGLARARAGFAARLAALTPTERLVLTHLAVGKLNKQIAYACAMSPTTVKTHVSQILRKLGARSRTGAAVQYVLHIMAGEDDGES